MASQNAHTPTQSEGIRAIHCPRQKAHDEKHCNVCGLGKHYYTHNINALQLMHTTVSRLLKSKCFVSGS